jgi:hypothetical protein
VKLREMVEQIFIDPRKLTTYALDPSSLKGGNKAIMFQKHLGFTQDNYQLLLNQIQDKVMDNEATLGVYNEHGQRYQVDILINGIALGQQEIVRTGWIIKPNEDFARLTSVYIRSRK